MSAPQPPYGQSSAWNQGGYPPPGATPPPYSSPPAPAPGKRPGRGLKIAGIVMTIIGVLLAVGAIAGGVVASRSFSSLATALDNAHIVQAGDETAISLAAGDTKALWSQHYAPHKSDCDVTGPNGEPVSTAASGTFSSTVDGRSIERIGVFRATTAGDYSVMCVSGPVAITDNVEVDNVVGAVGGILVAVFAGLPGLVLLVAGIILWVVGQRRLSASVAA